MCVVIFQSNAKLKLVRSLAVCEESSGPFSNDGPPESVTCFVLFFVVCKSDLAGFTILNRQN